MKCFGQSGKDQRLAVKPIAQVKDFTYKHNLAQHQRLDRGVSILKVIYLVLRQDQPAVGCDGAEEEEQERCDDCKLRISTRNFCHMRLSLAAAPLGRNPLGLANARDLFSPLAITDSKAQLAADLWSLSFGRHNENRGCRVEPGGIRPKTKAHNELSDSAILEHLPHSRFALGNCEGGNGRPIRKTTYATCGGPSAGKFAFRPGVPCEWPGPDGRSNGPFHHQERCGDFSSQQH